MVKDIQQVVYRQFSRRNTAIKSLEQNDALKTLSNLKRAVVKAQQACQMAEIDLEDVQYGDMVGDNSQAVQSDGGDDTLSQTLNAVKTANQYLIKAYNAIDGARTSVNKIAGSRDVDTIASDESLDTYSSPSKKSYR